MTTTAQDQALEALRNHFADIELHVDDLYELTGEDIDEGAIAVSWGPGDEGLVIRPDGTADVGGSGGSTYTPPTPAERWIAEWNRSQRA